MIAKKMTKKQSDKLAKAFRDVLDCREQIETALFSLTDGWEALKQRDQTLQALRKRYRF